MNRIPPLLIAKLYSSMADKLILQEDKLLEILTEIETYKTAKNEFDKTIKMLKSYDTEIPYLKNKTGIGRVAIFLPFNMPFYSAVLYAFGPLLSGNEVILRPSSLTKNCFLKI